MTIADGKMDWKVVNTRNVDNVGIEIDHDEARNKHNETICQYLTNKDKYDAYLKKICNDLGIQEMTIIDRTMHPETLKIYTRALLKCLVAKLKGRKITNDYSLQWLLTHDVQRDLLLRTIKYNAK